MKLVNEAEARRDPIRRIRRRRSGKGCVGIHYWKHSLCSKGPDGSVVAILIFELNNALRAPKFAAIDTRLRKGSKGTLSAKITHIRPLN